MGAFYPTEYATVDLHQRRPLESAARWLPKPTPEATTLVIQAETQDIRYRLDTLEGGTNVASATVGFLLEAGQITTIPTVNGGISVCQVADGAVINYQWIT